MKNKLELLDASEGWIALFSGTTGMGEQISEEEAHNIAGANNEERVQNALCIWGAEMEETEITFMGY
tara:strand:- start:1285 stop:1485 length:201 start_codon:yes stop_codon:yes gene_type:complete